ncbi:MAG: hypothetical protein ACR2RF_24845 [Geminicoccaceae bacterium]
MNDLTAEERAKNIVGNWYYTGKSGSGNANNLLIESIAEAIRQAEAEAREARKEEREACAKIADGIAAYVVTGAAAVTARKIAESIRACTSDEAPAVAKAVAGMSAKVDGNEGDG